MNKPIDERIEALAENELMKELIAMPGVDFNQVLEIIKRKRFERMGVVYLPDGDMAGMDTPEG